MIGSSEASSRVQTAVDDLDETIRQIRSTIFALQSTEPSADHGLRARVLGLVDAVVSQLGFTPGVRMEGLLDTNVEDEVADEVVAVLQEGLSNVVRHARASRVDVVVEVTTDELSLRIVDNGVGISANGRRSGLANLASRASRLGGTFAVSPRNGSEGTRLEWRVPLG